MRPGTGRGTMTGAVTRRGATGLVLAAALASLIVPAGPAAAGTYERTYLPPFEQATSELAGCESPLCTGETSAAPSGVLGARLRVIAAGLGRSDLVLASVKLTHTLPEPASEVSVDLSAHIDAVYVSAIGAPFARSVTKVALEAGDRNGSAYEYVEEVVADVVADAASPIGEAEDENRGLVLSLTLRRGAGTIPAGPIDITVSLIAETTTISPHAAAGLSSGCAGTCVGVGSIEASISGEARSVTVEETR